jgi:hypothetical protein
MALRRALVLLVTACSTDISVVEAVDADGDGYLASVDCDDAHALVNPDAEDACDGVDNDCDGLVDNGATGQTWYFDADLDGYGDDAGAVTSCEAPDGAIEQGGDCDDGDSEVRPDALERCDGVDNDCDALVDDDDDSVYSADLSSWYADEDGDGYGDPDPAILACLTPDDHVEDGSDCDDSNDAIHPGADEVCNELDDDCDEVVDDGGAGYCCTGTGLVHKISDGCMSDNGLTMPGDSLEVYCVDSVARFCLSGEACPWREGAPAAGSDQTCEHSGLSNDVMATASCELWAGNTTYTCDASENVHLDAP